MQSPAENILLSDEIQNSFTTIPLFVSIPAFLARSWQGNTPIPTTAISASIIPEEVSTEETFKSPFIPITELLVLISTPLAS